MLARHGVDTLRGNGYDDRADNGEGARSAGLAGAHWDLAEGHDLQLARLAEHGVRPEA